MGETFWNNVFTINIYGEGGRESLKVTADKFNWGSWVVSTTYVLNKTPRVVTFLL
jgi:hypothetical protein